ncbi:MAG: cupredoxin domain-containing protein [Bacilli bacterium]
MPLLFQASTVRSAACSQCVPRGDTQRSPRGRIRRCIQTGIAATVLTVSAWAPLPFSGREGRAATGATAATAATGATGATGATAATAATAAAHDLVITDRQFSPQQIAGRLNQTIKIVIRNQGTRMHNFVLPAFYIFSPNLSASQEVSVEFIPDKQGVFPFFSDAGGRKEPGLSGEVIVR